MRFRISHLLILIAIVGVITSVAVQQFRNRELSKSLARLVYETEEGIVVKAFVFSKTSNKSSLVLLEQFPKGTPKLIKESMDIDECLRHFNLGYSDIQRESVLVVCRTEDGNIFKGRSDHNLYNYNIRDSAQAIALFDQMMKDSDDKLQSGEHISLDDIR